MSQKVASSNNIVKQAKSVLRALDHPLRSKILDAIREVGKINVTDLYVKLRLEQSVASQHLNILRKVGIVNSDRDGKFVYYTVCNERINKITELCELLVSSKGLKIQQDT